MGKEKRYQIQMRSYARQCMDSGADNISYYIIEDITRRTEKVFLNRYIKSLVSDIEQLRSFNMMERVPLLEKTLQLCQNRLSILQ